MRQHKALGEIIKSRNFDPIGPSSWQPNRLGGVKVVRERVVRDGNIWSAAGVSAGIDLALAFIESYAGEDVAGRIQFGAEYFPSTRRYGDLNQSPEAPGYLKQIRSQE